LDAYFRYIPCIFKIYSRHISLFSLSSYNIERWTHHPAKESFCTLHILIKAIYVFEWMKSRFHSEKLFWVYTRYIPGISTGKVYTWNIPGIYQEKHFWGFQMGSQLERPSGKGK
jgi:hypothetical protein